MAVLLNKFEDMSYAEIAEVMGRSPAAVKSLSGPGPERPSRRSSPIWPAGQGRQRRYGLVGSQAMCAGASRHPALSETPPLAASISHFHDLDLFAWVLTRSLAMCGHAAQMPDLPLDVRALRSRDGLAWTAPFCPLPGSTYL